MTFEMATRIQRVADLRTTPVDNEIVIMNMAKNNYVALDDIGRRIWELLENPCRIDEMCHQLSREFEVTPEQAAADVFPFLEELKSEGLIRICL
ncbi:MAG: PqqD family protein [Candidatus Riflebacteria bacterium]|nr:PqqD family protein [Candidatus Riflebacteria bacterium]